MKIPYQGKPKDPEVFSLPVRRGNLRLKIMKVEGEKTHPKPLVLFHAVVRMLEKWKRKGSSGSVIIYTPTVKGADRLHKWLKARDWNVKKYTGKTPQKRRAKTQ